jgi:nucleotide-binding universal stress UspA family protein
MSYRNNYIQAVSDFNEARRKADLREIISRISGESTKLLSYEEVRNKLNAYVGNTQHLKDIPLDAIIGSVGRYTDFTKDFLPRRDSDKDRWAAVMVKATSSVGLPPIHVYKIGDSYFVLDGNHRVSVARELGARYIQAYVFEVITRVPLAPDTQPDQLIIKAEQVKFLEQTQIDKLRTGTDLFVTNPGQYPILEEHISVHRYFMGIEAQKEISYQDAVTDWYDKVYLPVIKLIKNRGILGKFPNRTETDLYLWISKHQADLGEILGWELGTAAVAEDLVYKYVQDFSLTVSRLANRILEIVTPLPLESGPPTGYWREKYISSRERGVLFENILVALDQDTSNWFSLDQALIIARQENANIRGLHVEPKSSSKSKNKFETLKDEFSNRCLQDGIKGELALESGGIARIICERSHWADIIILNLTHPPSNSPIKRFRSGFRTLIRGCPRPVLAVPGKATALKNILLAFNATPKSREALYISAYIASKWGAQLSVLTIDQEPHDSVRIQEQAKKYLESYKIKAEYFHHPNTPRADTILQISDENECDLILMGGYKASPIVEVVFGSIVDQVLRRARIPILVCR